MEFSHAPQVTKMPDFEKLHRKEMRRKLMHEITREVTWFSRFYIYTPKQYNLRFSQFFF